MGVAEIKKKIAAREIVYGTFFQYVSNPAVVDVLPDEGLDFVIVNIEHNHLDLADFIGVARALHCKGIACLVRTHGRSPDDVARVCDSFDGVVVPYAEDLDEIRRVVGAAKYRPLKGAALDRVLAGGEFPSAKTRTWVENKCAGTLLCLMIESVAAVERLDEICAIPGIDALFVGPNDLTVSMGIPEERDNPEFVDMLQRIIDTADKHDIPAGAHFSRLSHARRLIEQGARFIPYSSDLRLIQFGVPEFLQQLGALPSEGEEQII